MTTTTTALAALATPATPDYVGLTVEDIRRTRSKAARKAERAAAEEEAKAMAARERVARYMAARDEYRLREARKGTGVRTPTPALNALTRTYERKLAAEAESMVEQLTKIEAEKVERARAQQAEARRQAAAAAPAQAELRLAI